MLLVFLPFIANSGELTGFVAVENRTFFNAPVSAAQDMSSGPTIILDPEYYHVTEDNKDTITFHPFAHFDPNDGNRNHWDIRQLDWLHVGGDWGVTESNHLVDVINQTDNVEDIDGEDKLGQPMVQVGMFKDWGSLRFFYLPYFRERTFAGTVDRLRGELPVETDNSTYDAKAKEWHPDFAMRYNKSLGNWDVGISHFSGTSREPTFSSIVNADGQQVLVPHYDLIDQTGTDIQYTKEGWLWKIEAMTRTGQGDRFAAFTGGVEYTLYSIIDSNMDLGLLAEYQFDDRSSRAPQTFSDNDVFGGLRLTFNDIQDTAILAGASVDNNTQATFYFIEAERRIGNSWKAELNARIFSNIESAAPESGIRKDDLIQLRLSKYF
jgi:hypothetical protein